MIGYYRLRDVPLSMPFRYKLLFLTLLLLPYTDVGRIGIVKPAEIVLFFLICIYYFNLTLLKSKTTFPPLIKYFLVIFIYLIFTSIISPQIPYEVFNYKWYEGFYNQNRSLFYLGRSLFFILSYYVFMKMIKNRNHLIMALKCIIFSTIVYVIAVSIAGVISPDLIFVKAPFIPYRLQGLNSEPNSLCTMLSSVFFLFLTLTYFKIKDIGFSRKLSRILLGILVVLIFLSFSTLGYIAILVGSIIFYWNKKNIFKRKIANNNLIIPIKVMTIIFISIVLSGAFLSKLTPYFQHLITGKIFGMLKILNPGLIPSSRGLAIATNIMIFLNYPIFGVGIGRSPFYMDVLYPYNYKPPSYMPDIVPYDSYNSYTLLLCETGILGVILFAVLLYKIIKFCNIKSLNQEGKIISLYTIPTFVAFLIGMSGTAHLHYQTYFVLGLVFLIRNYQINRLQNI